MEISGAKRYIDYKVYDVMKIKNKYGFRIKLIFDNNEEIVQQKSGFINKKTAKEERDKILGELYSGQYIVVQKTTVREFLEFWLENDIKLRTTYSTYTSYKNMIYRHIIPQIGNMNLELLNKSHLEKLYSEEASKSCHAVRQTKAVMDSALKYAFRKKLINVDPTIGVKLPKNFSKGRYKSLDINTKKTLNLEQLKILINASKGTCIYLQILFSALMGLRESEVNGLKYSDVDFLNRKLKVQRQLGIVANSEKEDYIAKTYTKQEIPVKTFSSNRELDIPDIVFEAILEQKRIYEKNKKRRINDKTNPFQDLGYICCSSYGRPRSRTYNFPHFKKLLKENNLPDIRWHDLRATYATILLKNNFNLKAVSKKLGHATQIITADVYADKEELVTDCVNDIESFIADVLPKKEDTEVNDFTDISKEVNNNVIDGFIEDVTSFNIPVVKEYHKSNEEIDILDNYIEELCV